MWEILADIWGEHYASTVDFDDEYCVCPDCGESIYRTAWNDSEYMGNKYSICCPACECRYAIPDDCEF